MSIIVIKSRFLYVLGAVAMLLPLSLCADDAVPPLALSVDARFDKTGDGLVDASDWDEMSEDEHQAYAKASLLALGRDVDMSSAQGKSKVEAYLKGLRSVYE